jgi:ribosomal protein S18 acetylase RimI-like enzyme
VLSVKADNHRAIALYQRHGFVDAGQSPDDADERLMRHSHGAGHVPEWCVL